MTSWLFTGPTLEASAVPPELDLVVSGPAAFGDVYRAAQSRPYAIAIIDGYFDCVPAVWHKEILWAMSEGVHVLGSSSMGALRAAELADFGMEGVGAIYEAYRSGKLEDDDEVAVVHRSAADGYAPLSEALVNMRATLHAATIAGVITEETADGLRCLAKARFYAERTYASVIADAKTQGLSLDELQKLREWLPGGRVDQKRLDALSLLRRVSDCLCGSQMPKKVTYRFEPTDAWLEACRATAARGSDGTPKPSHDDAILIEELKLSGVYPSIVAAACARGASIDIAARAAVHPDAVGVRAAVEELRRSRGLRTSVDFDRWRREQLFEDTELKPFFEDQARLAWSKPLMDGVAQTHLVSHLRATGEYGRFVRKAEEKARRLVQYGVQTTSIADLGITENTLWSWYFSEHLTRPLPTDLEAFARSVGFADKDEMRVAVLRELQYTRLESGDLLSAEAQGVDVASNHSEPIGGAPRTAINAIGIEE